MTLIDADEVRDEILHDPDYDNDTINHFLDVIDYAPTVDAQPVIHAHWNFTSRPNEDCMGGSHNVIECSNCKEDYDAEYDYCPSCGALMDEGSTHEHD